MADRPKYHKTEIYSLDPSHPDDAHSVLMRLVSQGSRVLELGCASGYLSGYMEQALGCKVTGLELDPLACEIAATRCSEVHQANLDTPDALEPARASAPYDVLLAPAVLEHLCNPEALLAQARELLNPGARVIVSLPNIAYWQCRLNLLLGRFDYEDYGVMDRTHLRLYTLKTGRALLEDQGYPVEAVYIAGSLVQNMLNMLARRMGRALPSPVLPGLLGYELIYVARRD